MDIEKRKLADWILAQLALHPTASDTELTTWFDQLPPHPASWNSGIAQSVLQRWSHDHPPSPLTTALAARAIANLDHANPDTLSPSRKTERKAQKLTRAQQKRWKRTYLRQCVDWFLAHPSAGTDAQGRVLLPAIRAALPIPFVDGAFLPVGLDAIRHALEERKMAVWDSETQTLLTSKAYAQKQAERQIAREAAHQQWHDTATVALNLHRTEWLEGPGVPEATLCTIAQAHTSKEIKAVRKWATQAGLVSWSLQFNSFYGSAEAAEKARHEAEQAAYHTFLRRHHSTVALTQSAWQALGLPGDPPPSEAFWAPMDDLPVFTEDIHPFEYGLVTLAQAGLHRVPRDISAIATLQTDTGWVYHRYIPLYRATDLQPYSTQLLVRPEIAATPFRFSPPHSRQVFLHVGPTNAGKTYATLQALTNAKQGAYLAPLRLLAWEAYERLNALGCPTRLLTGEESLDTPNAQVVAATIEMLPLATYDTVVVDEAQLIADPSRGGAWTRALALTDTHTLHVCCTPEAAPFLTDLFKHWGDTLTIIDYERLMPLAPESEPMTLRALPPHSAVIAFSRTAVLRWKAAIERAHPNAICAVIYGALPPDVRRAQVELVQSGEAAYVAATDAIGLGLNLPLDHVYFAEAEKYDGTQRRALTGAEVRQIAGRAGRFGLATEGTFGGFGNSVHHKICRLALTAPAPVEHGVWHPVFSDLAPWPWRLGARLRAWRATITPVLPNSIHLADLDDMLHLADLLPAAIEAADPRRAFRLLTAPAAKDTLPYWTDTVRRKRLLKPPSPFSQPIIDDASLEAAERALHEHDLCLWFARHDLFQSLPDLETLHRQRNAIARSIHDALCDRQVFGRCRACHEPLLPSHPYPLCDDCYRDQRLYSPSWHHGWDDQDDDWDDDWDDD